MSADEILKSFEGEKYQDLYTFKRGRIPVLLMAHVDTVQKEHKLERINDFEYKCLGADDRVGVSIIEMLTKEYDFSYLLTNYEEDHSRRGANQFIQEHKSLNNVNLIVCLDRRGSNHYVEYSGRMHEETKKYIEKTLGINQEEGTFSDCCVISEQYNIAHINLGVGYYEQHTSLEWINIIDVESAMEMVKKIILNPPDKKLELA